MTDFPDGRESDRASSRGSDGAPGPDAKAPSPTRSHPLLEELVYHSLDQGYAQAAARRGTGGARRWYDRPAVAFGALLAGFLLVLGYQHANRTSPQEVQVHGDLVTRVQRAQAADATLGHRLGVLEAVAGDARSSALPASGPLAQRLERAELAAGQLAVHGPGVVVTLTEPPAPSPSATASRAGTVPETATNILTDRDVRSVVNELWHDGAEAIAVNGIRLTPMSAIRFAGQAILVDFRAIASPYTVSAIGDADQLDSSFAESDVASRYQTLAGVDGIGFTFTESSDLRLPSGTSAGVHYARVGTSAPHSSGGPR